ncbi:hypothetical protein SAMN05192539_10041, partial [Paraburkholderia diazotrophica]
DRWSDRVSQPHRTFLNFFLCETRLLSLPVIPQNHRAPPSSTHICRLLVFKEHPHEAPCLRCVAASAAEKRDYAEPSGVRQQVFCIIASNPAGYTTAPFLPRPPPLCRATNRAPERRTRILGHPRTNDKGVTEVFYRRLICSTCLAPSPLARPYRQVGCPYSPPARGHPVNQLSSRAAPYKPRQEASAR